MKKLIKYITLHEFKKVLKAERLKKYKLAYVLGFGSGLRLAEVIGFPKRNVQPLQREQVDLQAHQIRVTGKGSKERITVTSPWLNESNLKLLPLLISRRTLQRRINHLSMKVLNKNFTFHTLRHGFANYMANEKGVPLPHLQTLMGHSRLDTTGIYTKANPVEAIKSAWEVF